MKRSLPAFALLLFAACGGEDPVVTPTLANVETTVFKPSCAFSSCHSGASPQGGLNLSGASFDQLVNVASTEKPGAMRVVPSKPDDSFLMDKLLNRNLPTSPTENWTSMPPGDSLDAERLELVRAWIADGAKNN